MLKCIQTELDVPNDDELCAPLTEEEIRVAISHLKNGRAPGLDEISAEMLKVGGDESVQCLKLLSDCIWREETIPNDWKSQLLIPLHKRGSRVDCDKYQGIALLSIPSKVFSKASPQTKGRSLAAGESVRLSSWPRLC